MPANLAASFQNDYQLTDGTQTVTYVSKNSVAGDVRFTVNFADPHAFTTKELAAANGFFNVGDKRWLLGANQFPAGVAPKQGDQIIDASSVTWEVADATLDDFTISWSVSTKKAR